MKKLLLTVAAISTLAGTPVLAADMAVKAPPPPPAAAPAWNWSGYYVGVGLGGRWMDNDWNTTGAFYPNFATPIAFTTSPNALFSSGAFRVSGFLGYNWQVAPTWIVGLEGDFGWANNRDTLQSRIPGLGVLNAGSFTQVNGTWDATGRARAGYLITPTLLAYATGGVAFQHVEAIATCPADTNVCNPAFGTVSFSNSSNRAGWTVGGGLEAPVTRQLIARIEYDYADFGTFSFTAIPPAACCTVGANASLSTRTQTLTAGLAYKF